MSATLPREIIKWIQSLDLSYSVRDVRRDLNNGFLLAEIFSRYFPGKVQMHSFDNSQNYGKRKNNWELIELFLKKNEEDVYKEGDWRLSKKDYKGIIEDNNFADVNEIFCKFYSILTKKKIAKSPLANFIKTQEKFQSTTQTGTSFILREKGLERLTDEKKIVTKEHPTLPNLEENKKMNETNLSEKMKSSQTSATKKTNYMRNYSKPISQSNEAANMQIEVKNISYRVVNFNSEKLKEKKEHIANTLAPGNNEKRVHDSFQKSGVNVNEHNPSIVGSIENTMKSGLHQKKEKNIEKAVYDLLNDILTIRFTIGNFGEEMKKIKVKNNYLIQAYIDNIELFSDEFSSSFFTGVIEKLNNIMNQVVKDPNDIWKFMNFLFLCLKGLGPDKDAFKILINLIITFGQKIADYNPTAADRSRFIFLEYFLAMIAKEIKNSLIFERKEYLLRILYAFCQNSAKTRHELIVKLKTILKNQTIFMECLLVLLSFEKNFLTTINDEKDLSEHKLILTDSMQDAKIYLFSNSTTLRIMSLGIISQICDINYELVFDVVFPYVHELACNFWWECKCLAIIIFSKLITEIIKSDKYQNLIKPPQLAHKSFNLENEQLLNKIKEKINYLAMGIVEAASVPSNEIILNITLINIVPLLDNKYLLELFVDLLLSTTPETRNKTLYSTETEVIEEYLILSDKSLKYKVSIDSSSCQKHAGQMLIYLVDLLKKYPVDQLGLEHFEIIVYGFTHTDFKLMNTESCENISNSLKEYVILGLCDEEVCHLAKIAIEKILNLIFFAEVNIRDTETLFSSAICLIYQNKFERCIEIIEEILKNLLKEAFQHGTELGVRDKSGKDYLELPSLKELFKDIEQLVVEDFEENKEKNEENK